MAHSAIKSEDEKKEYFDTEEELDAKIDQLAEWVLESNYFSSFTGAGISTSAGIADYRSGLNTVLPTGPGCWEKASQKKSGAKPKLKVEMIKAIPSSTHMALVKLMELGRLKYIISQNIDGLHRRSGIPSDKIAEVHGNYNLEVCKKCHKEYMRDFHVRTAKNYHQHDTGRLCEDPKCKGPLKDNIINFGENLVPKILDDGFMHSARSDLCLAMGSSLRVTPAADMPEETVERGGKLVIVNLQKTPLDDIAALCIHAFCDTVMEKLMNKLNIEIPQFKLVRRMRVTRTAEKKPGGNQEALEFLGIDSDGSPFTLFQSVTVQKGSIKTEMKKVPLKYYEKTLQGKYKVTLKWQGHYNEPQLDLQLDAAGFSEVVYVMVFNPFSRTWESVSTI